MTLLVQLRGGAVTDIAVVPLGARFANAALSYLAYLGSTFLTAGLSFYYRYPDDPGPLWQVAGALALIVAASALALQQRRRRPWLLAGWLWYVIWLVPVIGIVQAGMQARADRYTYLPLVGVFVAFTWSASGAFRGCARVLLAAAAIICLIVLAGVAWRQTGFWKNDATLYGHAVAIDPGNYLVRNNLANALKATGRVDEAVAHYEAAIALKPAYATPHYNLGLILRQRGDEEGAIRQFQEAVKDNPSLGGAQNNLGYLLMKRGRLVEAVAHLKEAWRLLPKGQQRR